MSFTRWSIRWGKGHPMTIGSPWSNLTSSSSSGCGVDPDAYGNRCDPGDRKSDWDFRLHVPGLKKFMTLYADSYDDDELSPIAPRLDFRAEMASSEVLSGDAGGNRFFINEQYRDANTNKGFLLGNAVGHAARAYQFETTYWQTARTFVTAGFRRIRGGAKFLPGGSTLTEAYMKGGWAFKEHWVAQAFAQYERFLIPSMTTGAHHNVSAWLQIAWTPNSHLKPRE